MLDGAAAQRAAELIERIGRLVQDEEQAGGLPPVQWEALRYLARANRFSRTPAIVAEYLGSTRGTVSQTLIALEAKGLVERRPSERDRRSVALALTPAGHERLRSDPLARLAGDVASALGSKAADVTAALEAVLHAMLARNGRRAFAQCRTCRHFGEGQGSTDSTMHRCGLVGADLSDLDSEGYCVEHQKPAA